MAADGHGRSLCRRVVDRRQRRRHPSPVSTGPGLAPTPAPPRPVSPASRMIAWASAPASPAGTRPCSSTSSASAPTRLAATGRPAAIASAAAKPKVSAEREGTSAIAAPARSVGQLSVVHMTDEAHLRARRLVLRRARSLWAHRRRSPTPRPRSGRPRSRRRRPSPARDARPPARRTPGCAGGSLGARLTHRRREHVHALPGKRRAELAQPLARERARHDHRIGLLGQTALPQRQRRAIGGRLGQGSTRQFRRTPGSVLRP